MFGSDDNLKQQTGLFTDDESIKDKSHVIQIDFHQRKVQVITGIVVLLLLGLFGYWWHVDHLPMTDYPPAPSQYSSNRKQVQNNHYQVNGELSKEHKGQHVPDGFHQ